jgi:hypothetical protein
MKREMMLLLGAALLLALIGGALRLARDIVLAQSGGDTSTPLGKGYDVGWSVVGNAGDQFVSGGDYQMGFTLAQDTPPLISSGGDYQVAQGFWNGSLPACARVTGMNLALATSGVVYTGTVVEFSADIVPNDAEKPYTYTINYGDGISATTTSNDDPLTTPLDHTFIATGTYDVEIAVWNCNMTEAQAVTDTVQVVVSEQGVTCAEVTGVDLSLVTSGDIYTDIVVEFSANFIPDNADKPYTYTIDYSDSDATTSTSSDDPLTTPLDHTFIATGTYDVEIAVWNCDMSEAQAVTDTVQVVVSERPPCTKVTGVDLSLITSGDIYTGTVVEFSADILPDDASKPYTCTVDYGTGASDPALSSDDPLTTPLDHTFTTTGTYDVEIAIWNCDMAEAVTSVVTLTVYAQSVCVDLTEITIHGDESGTPGVYTFTASYEPSDATPPIAYLWNNGDDAAISVQSLDVGTHTVTVTATNCTTALVTDTHTIVIQNCIYLPLVLRNHS